MSEKRRYGILPLLGIVLLTLFLLMGTATAVEVDIIDGNITILKNSTSDSLDIKVEYSTINCSDYRANYY